MANLVITSTTNSVKVVSNDLGTVIGFTQGTWAKFDIYSMKLFATHVEISTEEKDRGW